MINVGKVDSTRGSVTSHHMNRLAMGLEDSSWPGGHHGPRAESSRSHVGSCFQKFVS